MSGEMEIDVIFKKKKNVRLPGIEPGSQAWKAHMITTTLGTLLVIGVIEGVFRSILKFLKNINVIALKYVFSFLGGDG